MVVGQKEKIQNLIANYASKVLHLNERLPGGISHSAGRMPD